MVNRTIELVNSLLARISLKKVALLATLAFVGITLYTGFEKRHVIFDAVNSHMAAKELTGRFKIGDESERALRTFIASNPETVHVSVVSLDLLKNLRYPEWRWSILEIDNLIKAAQATGRDGIVPIWSSDPGQNAQMLTLINGEFACSPSDTSGLVKAFPELKGKYQLSCRTPIPPRYGYVSGYIVMHFTTVPDTYVLERIKIRSKQLAIEIYERDIASNKSEFVR